jgi:hypothetical protein
LTHVTDDYSALDARTAVRRFLIFVVSPTVLASYFLFTRDLLLSIVDQVPIAYLRIDFVQLLPYALASVLAATLTGLIAAAGFRRTVTYRAQRWGRAAQKRLCLAMPLLFTVIAFALLLFDAVGSGPTQAFIALGALTVALLVGVILLLAGPYLRASMRAWLSKSPWYELGLHVPVLNRHLRPYRGGPRLRDTSHADPVDRLPWRVVLDICAFFLITSLAAYAASNAADALRREVVDAPMPQLVLRNYGDDVVVAPVNLKTGCVTMRFTERSLRGDHAVSLTSVEFGQPIRTFLPDPELSPLLTHPPASTCVSAAKG